LSDSTTAPPSKMQPVADEHLTRAFIRYAVPTTADDWADSPSALTAETRYDAPTLGVPENARVPASVTSKKEPFS
jgi:hypothetical protein